jgi:hypothetical protein
MAKADETDVTYSGGIVFTPRFYRDVGACGGETFTLTLLDARDEDMRVVHEQVLKS